MRKLETLRRRPACVVGILAVIVFLVQMGLTLTDIPSLSLIQEYACIRQNPGVDPDSLTLEQCQTISVIREVNVIQMLSTLTTSAPAILTALIYGAMADSMGRKFVFAASLLGILIFQGASIALALSVPSISVEAVSVAGLALFIGGGIGVAEAMVFTIISDVTFGRWRTLSFQMAICSVLLAEIVAAVSTPSLMSASAWTPLYIGLGLTAAGALLLSALPETLNSLLGAPSPLSSSSPSPSPRNKVPTFAELRASLHHLRRHRASICLLAPAAALTLPLATATSSLLSRTVPIRYATSFAASSALVAVRAGTTIFVLLVLLPPLLIFYNRLPPSQRSFRHQRNNIATTTATTTSSSSSSRRDLDLARAFALFPVLGTLVLAAASSERGAVAGVVIFTLGAPVPGLARAVLARLVEPAHRGRFFGLLAVVEQTGFLVVGLSLSGLLDAGLRRNHDDDGAGGRAERQWLGLPLYLAAFLFALLALGLWLAHPAQEQEQEQEQQQQHEGGDVEQEQVELGSLRERAAAAGGSIGHDGQKGTYQ